MTHPNRTDQQSRRAVLRTIGVAGLTIGVGTGLGSAQAEPDRTPGRGTDTEQGGDRPDHPDFECPAGMDPLGTFEFVSIEDADGELVDCYFEQDDGEFHITITGYDSKDGEICEPIVVDYESDTHDVGQVVSFGGSDSHVDDEPDGVYESDLENPGGQQAAISVLHFCGTEHGSAVDEGGDETDNGNDEIVDNE